MKLPIVTTICAVVLAACQTTPVENASSTSAPKVRAGSVGFQNVKTLKKFYTGKSIIPVGNGMAYYLAKNGQLHTKYAFHNGGPIGDRDDANYGYGKAQTGTRPALKIGETTIPQAPALCIPTLSSLGYSIEGKKTCLTLFLTTEGSVYAPEFDSLMLVSEGSGAFQSVIHNEGKLRDIPPPVPSYYGNIKKYGGISPRYIKNFPNDLTAQSMRSEFRLYLAQAKAQSDAQLKAEIDAINKKYDEKWAREDRAKIAAAKKKSDAQKRQAAAERAKREQKCRAETGKACSSGGGLVGWMLTAGLKALEGGGSSSSSSGGGSYPAPAPAPAEAPKAKKGVQRDGDGWVSVDGRKIGRVWVSFGYNVSCSRGYNPAYDSGSPFGSSFKPDVSSLDQATAVLLQACKR